MNGRKLSYRSDVDEEPVDDAIFEQNELVNVDHNSDKVCPCASTGRNRYAKVYGAHAHVKLCRTLCRRIANEFYMSCACSRQRRLKMFEMPDRSLLQIASRLHINIYCHSFCAALRVLTLRNGSFIARKA